MKRMSNVPKGKAAEQVCSKPEINLKNKQMKIKH